MWNDTLILSEQNDAVKAALSNMKDATIKVVVRDDGSGTTEIFTKALSLFSADFNTRIGGGEYLDWCEDGMEAMVGLC